MRRKKGKLVVRHGPMWSDKTTWLIKEYRQVKKTLAFKPSIDVRYTKKAVLKSHNGGEVKAIMISNKKPADLLKHLEKFEEVNRVLIDETNFFSAELVKVIRKLVARGIDVFAAGLLLDSERKDFGSTKQLLEMADEVVEGFARCDYRFDNGNVCQQPAKYTYAKAKKEKQLIVGTSDLYGVACEEHYQELHISSI